MTAGRRARAILTAAPAAWLLALQAGCAAAPAPEQSAAETSTPGANPFASVLADNQSGLEIQWWTITDQEDLLAQALAPYATRDVPLSPHVRENWRRNGFRMVAVPADELGALLSTLPIEDKVNRIWLGQSPGWAVAAPGAPWRGGRSLLIDGETIELGSGQLRLLVRSWVSPTEGAPTLRTDVAVQYLNAGANEAAPSFAQARIRRPDTMGLIFRTLTAAMELSEDSVYCILSEDPETEWALGGADQEQPTDAEPTLPERAPSPFADLVDPDDTDGLGPEPPGIPLLADALLSRVELLPTRRQARSIVILAPSIPDRFRLAPQSTISTP